MTKILQQTTNPQIKGSRVTWLYRGKQSPHLIGDFNYWNPEKALLFARTQDGSWKAHWELPEDAYLEYAFWINGKRKLDPRIIESTDGLGNGIICLHAPGLWRPPTARMLEEPFFERIAYLA